MNDTFKELTIRGHTSPDGDTYGGNWSGSSVPPMENKVIDAVLCVVDFYKGRSSIHVKLKDESTGTCYIMLWKEYTTLVLNNKFNGRFIEGKFWFVKRGASYGLVYQEE